MQPIKFTLFPFTRFSLTVYLISLVFLGDHGRARVTLPKNVSVPALIIFGDSIVDQGANNNLNTLIKANFAPYGRDFGSGKPTGRFTNNNTPADFMVKELGLKDLMPAYLDPSLDDNELLTGVSFASGGTGYDPETPKIASVLSFPDQLNQFKEYIKKVKGIVGEERTQYILANSIFLVVASSNDIATTYFTIGIQRLHYDVSSYADLMISGASNFIQDIYKLGARRIGVFSAPPLGCVPSQRTLAGGKSRECVAEYNQASQLYNNKLQTAMQYLGSTLEQSRVVYIDIYNPLLDIIENPSKYGVEVVDKGCCGTGDIEVSVLCNKYSPTCDDDSKYLFWDSFHPTNKGYSILIDQVLGKYVNDFF